MRRWWLETIAMLACVAGIGLVGGIIVWGWWLR